MLPVQLKETELSKESGTSLAKASADMQQVYQFGVSSYPCSDGTLYSLGNFKAVRLTSDPPDE